MKWKHNQSFSKLKLDFGGVISYKQTDNPLNAVKNSYLL